MAKVELEDAVVASIEVDTAASHSVMAYPVYLQLRKKLGSLPVKRTRGSVKLADGSVSSRSLGTVSVSIKTRDTRPVVVTMFVVKGSQSLLGRNALQYLWPTEYAALCQVAIKSSSVKSTVQLNDVKLSSRTDNSVKNSVSSGGSALATDTACVHTPAPLVS